ncbi:hypothetical protein [Paludisphaera mucosa]|uniref:Uncharacterized protein n=1 Tax=Paludisphaera mucosa TaxID=3030827 RepID=A0ABT6FG88_9BACT|nr:hypothetical protein [Paludisphaera mucosa]MDG3006418.1 hypothetical protein [Paludisphaera mucosa]
METIEYRTLDKSQWGNGEWQDEPDKKQWQDTSTGYPCLIVRNRLGALCGYVGVPKEHPHFGKDYDRPHVEVHGGLTFADTCQPSDDESHGICHKTEGDDHVWWFGFDCAHGWDYVPGMAVYRGETGHSGFFSEHETYRNLAYVTREVESLARQLKAIAA